jgi:uncharacterized damage-inducible protein DinB
MSLNQTLLDELEREANTTKKLLEKVSTEHLDWKPHEKSYKMGALAGHISEIPSWLDLMLNADELDFATMNYTPPSIKENTDIMKLFEENLAKGKAVLEKATDEKFEGSWRMRHGEQIFFELPRQQVIRTWVFSHIVHHRAQLGVYLRLLNIHVPSTYGPTADEQQGM